MVGRRSVIEAVRAGAAREVWVAEGSRFRREAGELLAAADQAGVVVRRVPEEQVAALAQDVVHQGVAASVRMPRELEESRLTAFPSPNDAVAVVLDGVTDPHNVGAVARVAEAAGASVLMVRRRRAAGITPSAVKASAGALLHLPVVAVSNLRRGLDRLKAAGFWVVGLDAAASRTVHVAERPPGRLALVVGSEGEGLSRLVREGCDELLAIPLRGRVASLNASVAAGVALYAYAARP